MDKKELPQEILAELIEHLSLDADDAITFESSTKSVTEISRQWKECSFDLMHLTREERREFLSSPFARFRPFSVDGVSVTLFRDVQVAARQPRVSAVIIDDGTQRHTVMGA